MDQKKIINKLIRIAKNQQLILNKLAQMPAPQQFESALPNKREAETILNALPLETKMAVEQLEVHPGNVIKYRCRPGKSSTQVFQAIENTVKNLQNRNMLNGQGYSIQETV